jgi:hypothetical protein
MTEACRYVIPAKAGIQESLSILFFWIPDLAPRSGARPE